MDSKIISCKLFFIFLLFSTTFAIIYAFEREEIVGGYHALKQDFKYQASILGKYNFTYAVYLLCSAGILSNHFLLSSARCFIDKSKELKKLRFYAAVGENVLISKQLILREIEYIYVKNETGYSVDHNIAVSWLRTGLNLQNNLDLVPLELPEAHEMFDGQVGLVAGYGIDSINVFSRFQNREQIRIPSKLGLYLTFASVSIMDNRGLAHDDFICETLAREFEDFCGIILPDAIFDIRGVCLGDNGAPLVIGRKVVGIVSRHSRVCHDVAHGTIYTKVSKYKDFLDLLLGGRIPNRTIVYTNNAHFANPKYRYLIASASTS